MNPFSFGELAQNGLAPRGQVGRVPRLFDAALRGLCASDEPFNVLTAEERDVLSEFLAEKVHEPAAVVGFLGTHAIEDSTS